MLKSTTDSMNIKLRGVLRATAPLFLALSIAACTNNSGSLTTTPGSSAITPSLKTTGTTPTVNCTSDQVAEFEKPEGELLDLDHEPLVKGLYLASVSQLMMEKRIDGSTDVARLMAREVAGTKIGEILCTENMEKLTGDFDMSITGLIKFDTGVNPNGDSFTARQFYVFSDQRGRGVVLSNPDLGTRAQDLKRFLSTGVARGQFYRLNDRSYMLRFIRERYGARILLTIRLDLIPSGY